MARHYIFFVLCCCSTAALQAQNKPGTDSLRYPELVSAFYTLIDKQSFWFSDTQSTSLRKKFVSVIDSAANWGLDANNYHAKALHRLAEIPFTPKDSAGIKLCELMFTDAAISFFKDMYEGSDNKAAYDELSPKYIHLHNRLILNKLVAICNGNCVDDIIRSLEPENNDYVVLKKEYQKQISKHALYNALQLRRALNYLRWINHLKFVRYIVINIPSASLGYHQGDTIAATMRVIVGKPSTQTPRFAAYCDKIILYPYRNISPSITADELLPLFKKNANLVNDMNIQVIDNSGAVVNPLKLNWPSYNKNNFPYQLRQLTGCDDAPGVMKFNLTNPFNVFMHDTNNKSVFYSERWFYSSGCIILEKPLMLANLMLPPVDSSILHSCLKDEKPMEFGLADSVPVFIIYSTVGVDAKNNVVYYKDVYKLLKK